MPKNSKITTQIYAISMEIAAWIVWILSGIGAIGYLLHYFQYIGAKDTNIVSAVPTPIDLAGVTATIGGLILIGAFYKKDTAVGNNLKTIAKLLLCSSVLFVVSFLSLEYIRINTSTTISWAEYFYAISTDVSIIVALITLCIALGLLVRVLPRL